MKLLSCLFEQSACFVKCFNPDTFRGGSEEIVESWEIEEQGKRPIIVLVNGKSGWHYFQMSYIYNLLVPPLAERINYNMFGSYRVIVFDDPNQDICNRHFISQRTVGKTIFLYTIVIVFKFSVCQYRRFYRTWTVWTSLKRTRFLNQPCQL